MSAMLRSLRIRNLALVEELSWDLPSGFTAITGETGAGKSIIIGALKLLLGERADRGVVRTGAQNAAIEAVFELGESVQGIDAFLEERGIESCQEGELILKRSIALEGNGRQFINGSPCNLAVLRDLGAFLVDLHGPHDHQSLFSRHEQTLLLDRYAEALDLRIKYLECRAQLSATKKELEELENTAGGAARIAQLQEEIMEIRSANPSEEEEALLAERYKAASNSRRLLELSATAASRVEDEERGARLALAEAARLFRDLARIDPRAEVFQGRLEGITGDLDALLAELRDYASGIELDATELQSLEERLNVFGVLRRKYGPTLTDVLSRAQKSEAELERLSSLSELREKAAKSVEIAREKLAQVAALLGEKRLAASTRLAEMIAGELLDLGFNQAGFEIRLEQLPEPGPDGAELAEFLFSPNPGEAPQPLRSIASSGEISRVMLALKSALAAQDRIPLLVFDEIDANVGGVIASKVAAKMRELGAEHQVLCITHLPQVAAAAKTQFMVVKTVTEGRTETQLEPVSGKERVSEIARMLGGVSDSAKAHAESLMKASL